MQLAQAALPAFKQRGQGMIVNVGSIFGSIGFPCFAAYSASKGGIGQLTKSLAIAYAADGSGSQLNLLDAALFPRHLHMVLGAIAIAAGAGDAGMGLMMIGQQAAMNRFLAFTRAQETSADLAGVDYLSKAGISGRF